MQKLKRDCKITSQGLRTKQPPKRIFRSLTCFFYKHMKFRNQTRLFLAIYNFEAHIMLNFSRYRTTGMGKI